LSQPRGQAQYVSQSTATAPCRQARSKFVLEQAGMTLEQFLRFY
jgi:hypothetical protein